MASGSTTLSTLLAGLKAHAGAAAVAGTVLVGGGAAAAAVATGAVHIPQGNNTGAPSAATQIANCAGHNGDAANLAKTYKSMFGGDANTATTDICTIFVGTGGRHFGFGEVRQILDIAAAIENNGGSTSCLDNVGTSGSVSDHGKPTETPGKGGSGDHGRPTVTPGSGSGDHSGSTGQPTLTIPSASAGDTMNLVNAIEKADAKGAPLARLAQSCGAPVGADSTGSGSDGNKPDGTPEATETPGG
jgi:hypothetical protein